MRSKLMNACSGSRSTRPKRWLGKLHIRTFFFPFSRRKRSEQPRIGTTASNRFDGAARNSFTRRNVALAEKPLFLPHFCSVLVGRASCPGGRVSFETNQLNFHLHPQFNDSIWGQLEKASRTERVA